MFNGNESLSNEDDEPLHDDEVGRSENIKVIVRVRPLLAFEEERGASASVVKLEPADGQSLTLAGGEARHQLRVKFDAVFGGQSRQEEVYAQVAECATAVAEGFNATVFAYGQTGTGKTHTMFGPPGHVQSLAAGSARVSAQSGVIPRAIVDLFEHLRKLTAGDPTPGSTAPGSVGRANKKKSGKDENAAAAGAAAPPLASSVTVFCSFVQIYNEQVFDMLRDPARSKPLEVHEDRLQGIYVQGLSEYQVRTFADCLELLRLGEDNRATRETHMNMASSRSHSIFTLLVEQTRPSLNPGGEPRELRSKFNLVDLAGSEKWDLNVDMGADRVSEMTNINLSLYTLGRCIAALSASAGKKASVGAMAGAGGGAAAGDAHVPYRESKLTRLLQDSLGGNAKTRVVATLSPASDCIDESVSTLRFADRAKQVMVFLRQNDAQAIDPKLVEKLQREVAHLRLVVKQLTEHRSLSDNSSNGGGGMGAGGAATRGLSVSPVSSPSKGERARGGGNSGSINPLLKGASLVDESAQQLEGALEEERSKSERLAHENAQLRAALEAAAKATQGLNLTQNKSSPIAQHGGMHTPRGNNNNSIVAKSPGSDHGSSGHPYLGKDPPSSLSSSSSSPSPSSAQVEQAVRAAVARSEAKSAALVTALEHKVSRLQDLASTLQEALQGCSDTSQRFFAFEIEEDDLRKELSEYTTAGARAISQHEAMALQQHKLEDEARAAAAAVPKGKKGKSKAGSEGSSSPSKKRHGGGSGNGAPLEESSAGAARYRSEALSNHTDSVMPPLGRHAKPAGSNYGPSGDGSSDIGSSGHDSRKRTFLPPPSHERYSPAGGYGSTRPHESAAESFDVPNPLSGALRGSAASGASARDGDGPPQQPRLFESPPKPAASSRRPHNGNLEPLGAARSSKKPPNHANPSLSAPNSNRSPMAEYAATSGSRSSEGGNRRSSAQRTHEPALPLTVSDAFPPPLQDFDRSGGAGGYAGGPLSSMGGAPLSSGLSSYRVRGKAPSGNGSSSSKKGGGGKKGGGAAHVTVVNTEEAEESRLAAELAKAKARMAKHQKLQEWLRAKEEKEMALLDQEEARIQAAEKAEKAREKARQKRAKEAKKALKKHYAQLHADADLAEQPPPRSAQSTDGYGDPDQDSGNDVLRPSSTLVPYMASTQPSGTATNTPGDGAGSYETYGDEGFPPGSQDGDGEFDQYIGDSVVSGDYGPDDGKEEEDEDEDGDYNGTGAASARSDDDDDDASDEN